LKSSPLPPDLAEPLVRTGDRLGRSGRQFLYYETVGSTNDVAASLAEGGAPEGCVIIGGEQTSGRGRLGRAWASPPGAGLYVSCILRPEHEVTPLVTIAAGVAVARGIEAATGLRPDVKWPNDVVIGDRKVAGILAEATARFVILGFGINIRPAGYAADVAARATSLEREVGRPVDRGTVLTECVASLAALYASLREGLGNAVVDAWRTHAKATLGRRVQCAEAAGIVEGLTEDVDATGALLVRTNQGLVRIISGAVTWL
jgi:BirA family biotin operon repressor/biotin-[acetyl-CoA-carboxylase] ligase